MSAVTLNHPPAYVCMCVYVFMHMYVCGSLWVPREAVHEVYSCACMCMLVCTYVYVCVCVCGV